MRTVSRRLASREYLQPGVEHDVDGLGRRVLEAEPLGPGVAFGRRLWPLPASAARVRSISGRYESGTRSMLHEMSAQLAQGEERLHVVAAQLAGHVAVAAELALEGDIDDLRR